MIALFAFAAVPSLPEEQRQSICDWLTSVGVDPEDTKAGFVVSGPTGHELHVTEIVRRGNGASILGWRPNEVMTTERIVQLGDVADWPGADG